MRDPETKVARIVASLFRDTPYKPQGTLMFEVDRAILAADKPLAAYFISVAEAGPDAWQEERARIAERNHHLPPERRGDPLSIGSITAMLPIWRAWGRVIIQGW
jgi:hypothetical protein